MPRTTRPKHTGPRQPWYLREWMDHYGKSQADMARELDMDKGTVSRIYTGKQRYTEDLVTEAAVWLNLSPYELLMPPADAMTIRGMIRAATALVVDNPPAKPKTGTDG